MARKPIEDLKYAEYWTAPQAAAVMNIPYKIVKLAFDRREVPLRYFNSLIPKARADDVREWAETAPSRPGEVWQCS
jgi:hypothetical protein